MPPFRPEEKGPEDETLEALERKIGENIALWTENLRLLDEKIPHDDILEDNKTYSYHVVRNRILGRIDELTRMEELVQSVGFDA